MSRLEMGILTWYLWNPSIRDTIIPIDSVSVTFTCMEMQSKLPQSNLSGTPIIVYPFVADSVSTYGVK
jgi:hypothetical protein